MKKVTLLIVFLLGAVVGAVALFLFLVVTADPQEEVNAKPVVTTVSMNKQETCLANAAQQARMIYSDLAVRRGNLGVRIEFEQVSPAELKREDQRNKELYARIGASLEDCLTYGEPVKLDHHVLADMN